MRGIEKVKRELETLLVGVISKRTQAQYTYGCGNCNGHKMDGSDCTNFENGLPYQT